MNKLKLFAMSFILAGGLSAQSNQCSGYTKDNNQCKNRTTDSSYLCHLHNPNHVTVTDGGVAVICSGTTKSNNPCRNKTKDSSGLCHNHRK